MGVETSLVQAGAPVQAGSPPPVAVAVLTLGLTAVASIVMGTVTTMLPIAAPAAMLQPARVLVPAMTVPGHVNVPPVAVGTPLKVIPVGKTSVSAIGAVVAAPDTAMVIL